MPTKIRTLLTSVMRKDAEQRADDATRAAGDARAAQHHGGDHVDLHARQVERVGEPVGGDVDDARNPRQKPGIGDDEDAHPEEADAQALGDPRIAANREGPRGPSAWRSKTNHVTRAATKRTRTLAGRMEMPPPGAVWV